MLFPSSSTSAITTGSTRRRQDQVTLQQWRMEDKREMEDYKEYYLDIEVNPSSRQPPPRSVA